MLPKLWPRLMSSKRSFGRLYTTTLQDMPLLPQTSRIKKNQKRSTGEPRVTKEIMTYFNDPERKNVLQNIPEKLLKKKTKAPDGLYLASEDSARKLAEILKLDLPKNKTLIEVNPGIGLLTKHLISGTDNELLLYEPCEDFHSNLSYLMKERTDGSATLKQADLTSLWRLSFIDKYDQGNRVEETLKGIRRTTYDDESNARLFAVTGSLSFVKHLINSIIFQNSLMSYGRCELYLCLPPPLFTHLTCSNKAGYMLYRATTILFQILFEYEFICKINRKDFLPWQPEVKEMKHMGMNRFIFKDQNFLYLMKAVPRRNLHQYCLQENLTALWFFVKQHLISRKNQVIPSLERWIPGCGSRLIVNRKEAKTPQLINPNLDIESLPNFVEPCRELSFEDFNSKINIFTEFGDLSPTQMLTLFDQFVNWPEYKECSFSASLDNTLMKLHTNPDETVDGIELPEEDDSETNKVPDSKELDKHELE